MAEDTKAKYHHLIPQTYMNAWANNSGTLNVEFKSTPGRIEQKNKENIAGINDFHSIKAGMPICSRSDAETIFAPVLPFVVKYNGQVITDPLELNSIFYDYENWIIERANGLPVNKKKIRREIEKIKIKDIEINWSRKYENNWAAQVAKIENIVLNCTTQSVESFDQEYLTKFFTALDWRGFNSFAQFENATSWLLKDILALDEIETPEKERFLPSLKNIADENRHFLLLHYFRQYLNDTGIIYQNALMYLDKTTYTFLISDNTNRFITSDTPAFTHTNPDGTKEGILPITPRILLIQMKKSDENKYYVTHVDKNTVNCCNSIIKEHAEKFIIL